MNDKQRSTKPYTLERLGSCGTNVTTIRLVHHDCRMSYVNEILIKRKLNKTHVLHVNS